MLPAEINFQDSILFLGSGFPAGAKNIRGQEVPRVDALKAEIAALISADPGQHDLQILAEAAGDEAPEGLYQLLYGSFTVVSLLPHQLQILGQPWLRIYTTNYDNTVEVGREKLAIPTKSYSYNDTKPRSVKPGSVVHLHGTIRDLTQENVADAVVLTDTSYASQLIQTSPWFNEFQNDLRYCAGCFFVGYSLRDHRISSLMLESPDARAKTFFIEAPQIDALSKARLSKYGTVATVGATAFADEIAEMPKTSPIPDVHSLKAFRYFDPFADSKTIVQPTTEEIRNLLTFGAFNAQRCRATLPKAGYVIPRSAAITTAVERLSNYQCVLVHSYAGNGKTIFLTILAYSLAEKGHSCFFCRPNPVLRQNEFLALRDVPKPVLLFDSLDDAISVMPAAEPHLSKEARYIVATRTGTRDIRRHAINEHLPVRTFELSLNQLTGEDRSECYELLSKSGLTIAAMRDTVDSSRDLREIILTLYNNREVRQAIADLLAPALSNPNLMDALTLALILTLLGRGSETASLVLETLSVDIYREFGNLGEVGAELFDLSDGAGQVRSPLLADYLLKHVITPRDITRSTSAAVRVLARRKFESRSRDLMSDLLQFGHLRRLTEHDPLHLSVIVDMYEGLKNEREINSEPLFWLQYAIAKVDERDLGLAELLLGTAYDRAKLRPGYRTFQIDTQALRIYLMAETESTGGVTRYGEIIAAGEAVLAMLGETNHRAHAIRALESFEPFVRARNGALTAEQRAELLALIDALITATGGYRRAHGHSIEQRELTSVGQTAEKLHTARSLLISRSL